MSDCIFCKIIAGEMPCDKVYEDEQVIVFKDINPKAKTHWLVVPKLHIVNLKEVEISHKPILGHMSWVISQLAQQHEIGDFKVASNNGAGAGQIVFHMHWHVLSGAASLSNL
jgi:histidine triad (HIT) family protein